MTDNIESLVLEHLRHIRGRVDQIADDVTDLKLRMSALDASMGLVKREVNTRLCEPPALPVVCIPSLRAE